MPGRGKIKRLSDANCVREALKARGRLSREARSCPGRTARGNAGAAHSGPPALPKGCFDSLWVPWFYQCSGEINSPCAKVLPAAKRLYGAKAPPPLCGGIGEQALLSREARSCPGQTARGSAGAVHSAPPAPPKGCFDSLWVPGFYPCSGEINSPCAKVFACAKTLVRRKSAAAAARRNRRAGSAQPGGQVMSRPDSTWKCRCGTLWPACSPMLDTTR